ncbi:MAG: hypothetical protein IH621_14050, partial [Krumholzibacteria bacterium]|nr:hypothetical protein [Candidatus Krumholzibacteria bacterium]
MDERRRTTLIGGAALGLPLDDAWIHAAFARNLALDRTWGLFAGEPSGGESSLLWPAVLALGELGGAALAPVLALVLGSASFLILPGLVGALASTPVRGRWIAGAVGLCGPLVFLALSGMETIPALTAGTGALVLLRRGHVGRAATAAGIAVLLRPDSVLLVAVLAAGVAVGRRDGPPLRSATLLWAWSRLWPAIALVLLAVILLSLLERHFPPATLGGRRWLVGLPADLAPSGAPGGLLA